MPRGVEETDMKILLSLFMLAVCLIGCTSSYTIHETTASDHRTYSQLNEELRGRSATIVLKAGENIPVENVEVTMDSTSWSDSKLKENHIIPNSMILKIIIKDRGRGAIDGLHVGVFGGLAIIGAVLLGGSWGDNNMQWYYAGAMPVLGAGMGAGVSHTYEYYFSQ